MEKFVLEIWLYKSRYRLQLGGGLHIGPVQVVQVGESQRVVLWAAKRHVVIARTQVVHVIVAVVSES